MSKPFGKPIVQLMRQPPSIHKGVTLAERATTALEAASLSELKDALFGWQGLSVALLCNPDSGERSARETADRLTSRLGELGAQTFTLPSLSDGLDKVLEEARSARPDAVVAVGGDGTFNAAAVVSIDLDVPLLPAAEGTMNMIARDLGTPASTDALLARVPALRVRRVDYASVNGRVFLHSSLLGVVPRLGETRERYRDADSWAARSRSAWRFVTRAVRPSPMRIKITLNGRRERIATRSLAVTCNPLTDGGLAEHRRASLDSGRLGVYVSTHRGPLAFLRLLWSFVKGNLRRDDETARRTCTRLVVETPRGVARLANDGELVDLEPPLTYEVHARGLQVLTPAEPEGAAK